MKLIKVLVSEIVSFLKDEIISINGNYQDCYIDNIVDADRVNQTSLDWINPSKINKQETAEYSNAKVILVDREVCYSEQIQKEEKILIVVENPKVVLAKIGNAFFISTKEINIDKTAIIDPKARIGKNVIIGPYSVIGNVVIGDNTIIDGNVKIYDDVEIGNNCVLKSGVVLGGAGFGYEKDENGNLFRFPQIGSLVIGNYVEIGSNTCIDRGALSDTIIGDYSKINNLCHIAHNNKIGKNVVVTACVNISGSNIIEDNVWLAPNSSIRGWIHIGEGATIGMGAIVTKDVPAKETWVGNPARKLIK